MSHLPDAAIVLLAGECHLKHSLIGHARQPWARHLVWRATWPNCPLLSRQAVVTVASRAVATTTVLIAYCPYLTRLPECALTRCLKLAPCPYARARIPRLGHFNALRRREHSGTLSGFHNTTNLAPLPSI